MIAILMQVVTVSAFNLGTNYAQDSNKSNNDCRRHCSLSDYAMPAGFSSVNIFLINTQILLLALSMTKNRIIV